MAALGFLSSAFWGTPPACPQSTNFVSMVYFQRFREFASAKLGEMTSRFLMFVCIPFIFLPAWAYRFILKSTLWFWWILFIVGGAPRLDGGIEGLRADAYRKASAWVGSATAIFAAVGFGRVGGGARRFRRPPEPRPRVRRARPSDPPRKNGGGEIRGANSEIPSRF